jgi:hypothetical protein
VPAYVPVSFAPNLPLSGVVGHVELPVVVRVERRELRRPLRRLGSPAGERVAAAVVRSPQHRAARGTDMDRRRHATERDAVGRRLLPPRIPRAVHLVREANEDVDIARVCVGEDVDELADRPIVDRGQAGTRLECQEGQPMDATHGLDEPCHVRTVCLAERERGELDPRGGRPAEPVDEGLRRVDAPRQVHADEDAIPGLEACDAVRRHDR